MEGKEREKNEKIRQRNRTKYATQLQQGGIQVFQF